MEFCSTCENMLHIKHVGDKVVHKCNCCGNEVGSFGSASRCISKTKFYQKGVSYQAYVNPHVFDDPTLPTVNMACPNAECTKPAGEPNRVVYIKYDAVNMLFLYFCGYCKHHWTNAK